MHWLILLLAGALEIIWAIGLKYTDGFKRLVPSLITIGAMVLSVVLLSKAMETLALGTAYAIWTGIGALGTVILGIFLFKEPCRFSRVFFIIMILLGILGLKILS